MMGRTSEPQIIDLMNAHKGEEPWVALEYFPPRTDAGVRNRHGKTAAFCSGIVVRRSQSDTLLGIAK